LTDFNEAKRNENSDDLVSVKEPTPQT
jgi:hypothetical protein